MPPIKQTLRQRLADVAAEAMLDSAERAMIAHGYERATMQQIASEAGCAAGTFYLYFKNKRELLDAICARHAKAAFAEARAQLDKPEDPLERVRMGLEAFLRYGQKHRDFFRLFFTALPMRHRIIKQEMPGVPSEEHSRYLVIEMELLRQAQDHKLIRQDIPLERLKEFIDDIAFSHLEQFAFAVRKVTVDEQMRLLWGLITGGLGAGDGHGRA